MSTVCFAFSLFSVTLEEVTMCGHRPTLTYHVSTFFLTMCVYLTIPTTFKKGELKLLKWKWDQG